MQPSRLNTHVCLHTTNNQFARQKGGLDGQLSRFFVLVDQLAARKPGLQLGRAISKCVHTLVCTRKRHENGKHLQV
jgi:hypothetical protein